MKNFRITPQRHKDRVKAADIVAAELGADQHDVPSDSDSEELSNRLRRKPENFDPATATPQAISAHFAKFKRRRLRERKRLLLAKREKKTKATKLKTVEEEDEELEQQNEAKCKGN
jgi:hypothetical protein